MKLGSETVFLGYNDASKAYVSFAKASALGKAFKVSPISEVTAYPLDSSKHGTKGKALKPGNQKVDLKKNPNIAVEQGIVFKLNLLASSKGITPSGFGALQLNTDFTFAQRNLNGMPLSAISSFFDSAMTYWQTLGITNQEAYTNLATFSSQILKPINEGFWEALSNDNSAIDTLAVVNNKQSYAVTLKGVKTAQNVPLVKYVGGKADGFVPQFVENSVPEKYALEQNYPNPFNPLTVIRYELPSNSIVSLKIYDILGREVSSLLNNMELEEGQYETEFDANKFASGIYFYRLDVVGENGATFSSIRKMMLIK